MKKETTTSRDNTTRQRQDAIDPDIRGLIERAGGDADSFDGRMISELVQTSLKLIADGHDTGQLKLLNRALKEMRYAYRVFNGYRGVRKISIFGSARTPEAHPDYVAARTFSAAMASHTWMCITGAGDGIMKAGHEGPRRDASFGLSIRLPFETTANTVIDGDPKLINFRYFFTRKLMFISHSDAVAVFPGGFGTQDELFESLTLVQTGKSNIIPIVLVQGAGGDYWQNWTEYIQNSLAANRWISPDDTSLFYIAPTPADAVSHVMRFYHVYHSSRYVREKLVIRLQRQLSDAHIERLNDMFASLLGSGGIEVTTPLDGETDHLDLPRIAFHHNRYHYGRVRALIDEINQSG
ncbi:MAG: LOG family protein [Phycisphaerales bacterium]